LGSIRLESLNSVNIEANGEGSIDMDREYWIGASPSCVEFLRCVDFEQHLFAGTIIVVEPFLVSMMKTFVDDRLTRVTDGNEVGNKRNVQHHVTMKSKSVRGVIHEGAIARCLGRVHCGG
jgi:hypothetical protein